MAAPHIALVGAGSASFGLDAIVGILRTPDLSGARISLIDTHGEALEQLLSMAQRISDEWGADATFVASTDRREVLTGADLVVISVAVDREATWPRDRAIADGTWHHALR